MTGGSPQRTSIFLGFSPSNHPFFHGGRKYYKVRIPAEVDPRDAFGEGTGMLADVADFGDFWGWFQRFFFGSSSLFHLFLSSETVRPVKILDVALMGIGGTHPQHWGGIIRSSPQSAIFRVFFFGSACAVIQTPHCLMILLYFTWFLVAMICWTWWSTGNPKVYNESIMKCAKNTIPPRPYCACSSTPKVDGHGHRMLEKGAFPSSVARVFRGKSHRSKWMMTDWVPLWLRKPSQ